MGELNFVVFVGAHGTGKIWLANYVQSEFVDIIDDWDPVLELRNPRTRTPGHRVVACTNVPISMWPTDIYERVRAQGKIYVVAEV